MAVVVNSTLSLCIVSLLDGLSAGRGPILRTVLRLVLALAGIRLERRILVCVDSRHVRRIQLDLYHRSKLILALVGTRRR